MTQADLEAKWKEICDACEDEDGDPYPAWLAFLSNNGLHHAWSFGPNWGEYGIMPFVDDLVEIINKGEKLEILVDPSHEEGVEQHGLSRLHKEWRCESWVVQHHTSRLMSARCRKTK